MSFRNNFSLFAPAKVDRPFFTRSYEESAQPLNQRQGPSAPVRGIFSGKPTFGLTSAQDDGMVKVEISSPSFPNSIWERPCPRNSIARSLCLKPAKARDSRGWAMELPQQARSQMEFGNEETLNQRQGPSAPVRGIFSGKPTFGLTSAQDDGMVKVEISSSSFPNSIWERPCPRNSIARSLCLKPAKARDSRGWAMELPQQARSQMEFGNEETLNQRQGPSAPVRGIFSGKSTFGLTSAQDDGMVKVEVSR